jgi:fused signal recognition particle receptor
MNEDLILLSFTVLALILTVVLILFFRRTLKRAKEEEFSLREAERGVRPSISEQGLPTGEAEDLLRQDREPTPVTVPEAPEADVPADIAARPIEGIAAEAAPVHKVEDIQKPERKPLSSALSKTRDSFMGRLKGLFGAKPTLAANELEEIEEILYTSDLGPQTVQRLLDAVETRVKSEGGSGFEAVRSALKSEIVEIFSALPNGAIDIHPGSEEYLEGLERLSIWQAKPAVLMVVGVNGAGKTTTIGKVARRLAQSGRKVLVAAGDTFRAAAGDQLKVWTDRAQVEIFSPENVTDPSAVAFKACEQAKNNGFDVVIVDTAGRLHTQKNLMEELKKMKRVISKVIEAAPHEVLLVLDANSGQNALIQAREFHQALEVTGVVLTKLDGSAKGGVAVGLAHELKIPIKMIGVGEGIDDLRRFSSQEFVDSIF